MTLMDWAVLLMVIGAGGLGFVAGTLFGVWLESHILRDMAH